MVRRRFSAPRLASTLTAAAVLAGATTGLAAARAEAADEPIHVLVLRENGAGSAATAQKYIDQVMTSLARVNGWPGGASGKYITHRKAAAEYVETHHPHFGILTLGAFLALRGPDKLKVVGKADIRGGGGEQYYLVSKTATDLEGCKGKTLATNHAEDERFVDKVIGSGELTLADFEVEKTRRPLQTVKKVLRDEAVCALIDDAQMADLAHVDGGDALRPVWFSARFVPMVVVAFPTAPKAEVATFGENLSGVCEGPGKAACDAAGIEALEPAGADAVADVVAAYGK